MVIYFSQDIIFEILVKVPAKDLLRAKVVCKLWHSIISDPNFVNSQLAHSRSQPAEIIFKIYSEELGDDYFERLTITTQKHGIMQVEKICDMKFPSLQFPCTESTVKASCNGLLLIFHGKHPFETLYVYNPVTRQYVALPSMTEPLGMSCNPPRRYYSWTLFYNDSVGKYVVFGTFHSRWVVLTVGDKEWSRYQNPYPCGSYRSPYSQLIYVEKKVQWLRSETENGCSINPLECFHDSVNIGATMEFTRTILPEHQCNGFHTLFEAKGSLCFASQKRYWLQIFVFEKRKGNTNWNKCYSTNLESLPNLPQPIRRLNSYIFVGTRGDIDSRTTDYSDVVKIVMQHEDKLFYYDLKRLEYIALVSNEVKLHFADYNQVWLDIYPLFYASSLVKPEQDIVIG
ncbi:hypothetical protein IFM89_016025 [Coptis chinensis]|uniref:F-box domain-containing protein n=1 Tax=Coptis chinensis TaxID=261450 RepID=A0A835H443_9MAGN|nr:hypothetical protein IFM89_016025 [Coptis chinensis]